MTREQGEQFCEGGRIALVVVLIWAILKAVT
jgi:hypothetical protein